MFLIENLIFKDILDIPYLKIDQPISCIVGPSGSGKTTFLRMLNGLNKPDQGTIYYEGENISSVDIIQFRRRVVMLGQTPILYDGDIQNNLQIGLQFSQKLPASAQKLKEILERVGLNKSLGESCSTLSGGERQRLCLARVMLLNAEVYLLDEPSAALDRDTERFMIENLADFVTTYQKQMIMVTHSEQIAASYPNGLIHLEQVHRKGIGQ